MIPAADIQDQELAVRPERTGVDHPTVSGRSNLGSGPRSNGKPSFGPTIPVGGAKFLQFDTVNRNRNLSWQGREGYRRRQPSGIAECRERRAAVRTGRLARLARGRVESLFEFGDQIL